MALLERHEVGSPSSWSVVGKSVPRVDGFEKVTGAAQYLPDLRLTGTLEGKVLRSPFPHARIVRIDTSRARAIPGVVAVLTADDTPKRCWGTFHQDQPVLADGKVRYVGEEVAAVAAESADAAAEAVSLVEVEYEELPAVFDPEEAMRPDAPRIHEDRERNLALHFKVERGDPDGMMRSADLVLEDTFETRLQWQASLEPIGSIAQAGQRGQLTVWTSEQTVFLARARLAGVLDLKLTDVRVIQTAIGGGFGGKLGDDNNLVVCALLGLHAGGRPVRLVNTREEEFLAGRPRPAIRLHIRAGFRSDGLLVAKDLRAVGDNGAYSARAPGVISVAAMRTDTKYLLRDIRSEVLLVDTNKVPTGAFRGFGTEAAEFAMEQLMETAAAKLRLDPKQVALVNSIEAGHVSPHGNRVISCELKQCIERATAMIGWERRESERRPYRGIGLATGVHVSGKRHKSDFDGSSAIVEINEDGKVVIWSGEGEAGQGPTTVLCQVVAEALGVRFEDVSISAADTASTPYVRGAYASRLTFIAGNAVLDAARQLREQVLETAADLLEADQADLQIAESRVVVQGVPSRAVSVAEVAQRRLFHKGGRPLVAFGAFDADSEPPDADHVGNESPAYGFCAHAAEVEVDPLTGQFTVLQYVAASDGGTIVNPTMAEGQVEGAVAQGLGLTALEELHMDDGKPLNPNFSDYRLPAIADMPPFQQEFVPSYEPTGPFGAKGLGEIGIGPVAPAIANAIYDAVGVHIKTLPITPEKVLAAIQEKARGGADGSPRVLSPADLAANPRL